ARACGWAATSGGIACAGLGRGKGRAGPLFIGRNANSHYCKRKRIRLKTPGAGRDTTPLRHASIGSLALRPPLILTPGLEDAYQRQAHLPSLRIFEKQVELRANGIQVDR